jgi:tRNA(fMet)-specific endonuclease VapC
MLRYMLDTNICIYTIKNNPAAVREKFQQHQNHLCISSIVLSELLYGAEKSSQPEKSLALIEGMAARLEVLNFDEHAAAHAAEIRADLARKGTPIGHYDVLIAGHARSRGLVLVSNNLREFERVDGLRLENWAD